nr:unnamed protein product [Callosobruchus chinensis]
MDASYVPNNPQFGLQLECNWSAGSPTPGIQQVPSCTDDLSSCWSEDMGTFSLPLDLEPLPSLFNISPCSNGTNGSYKTEPTLQTHQQPLLFRENKQPSADVADVLLSLKHAVVHPSGQSPTDYHHHQMLLSPGGYSGGLCTDQPFTQQTAVFPSMSVNVSMNMTMHGYHPNNGCGYPTADITCPQVQWSTSSQPLAPSHHHHHHHQPYSVTQSGGGGGGGLLSPAAYGGATYSFTADFRPQPPQEINAYRPQGAFSPRRRTGGITTIVEEDGQKANVCRICGKSYARPSTLKTHLRTHSGEKPYRCADCHKSFSQAANLTAHVRTHSGEKPFRCPVCDRRFSQSSSVTTHMRTHSGERPYRCRLCKKAFSDSSTLTKHLRIHSGEKPYECKLCLLRFSQSGNLNRHMRVHGSAGAAAATGTMGAGIPP